MQIKKIVAVLSVALGLLGCSSAGKLEDYQRSGSIKAVEFPEGVKPVELTPLYPIPEIRVKEEAFYNVDTDGFVVPRPEAMSAEREQAKIKIQKVGERRWILAEAPTSQVWPLAQSFLMEYDMGTSKSVPATGLVETDWVVFKDDDSRRHQFRIRIEQGVRADTTEVHILQRSFAKSDKITPDWPEQSSNDEREQWALNEMANSLASNIGNKAASLLGQKVGGEVKAELYMDGAEPALRLHLDTQRAWATVAHSVTKEGFVLWDESSEKYLFFVQHLDFVPKRMWILRKIFGESKKQRTTTYKVADMLSHLDDTPEARALFNGIAGAEFAKALPETHGFLVVLKRDGEEMVLKIRDARGGLLPLQENKSLLATLRRNLI